MSLSPTNNNLLVHDPFYRLGVGMMVVNYNCQILVCQRADMSQTQMDAWQMPQGGIDFDEDPLAAALRELKEEIGTAQVSVIAEAKNWLSYDFPEELAKALWGGRFVGQKQKWYLLRYEGYESEINLNTAHPEFTAYKWVDLEQLPHLIVDFKRDLYHKLVAEFKPHIRALKQEQADK
ncbi:RNA pyrophosphohydrolase [Candidatus Odyssella thessalonicensis]|uniref:RNA pyrophosphohydrolase n=1 Tax=Candidatus Odyssella thessalonicensis TaxID=84647 RepID=UPI000225ABC2|nr:RNA pyrophosphohydrolase [Candidatus Odyssella thessalonicensis]